VSKKSTPKKSTPKKSTHGGAELEQKPVSDRPEAPLPTRAAVKITDVAAAAGVAPMTVSRVLNTPERVSAATAERVRAAIERLGYVPNLIAGGLSSRRSRMIAAIVPTIASPMFSVPVQNFTDVLAQHGYHVMLGLSGYGADGEDALIRAVLTRRPDGLMLTGANHSPAVRRLLQDAGVPVVEIWDASEAPTDMLVGFDHAQLGAQVADFFAAAGHTDYVMLAAGDPRAAARREGFVRRVAQHGGRILAERTLPAPSGIGDGRAALREIAPLLGARTALFGSSDLVAFGVMTEARVLGIAVPERLAVCGFGDFDISRTSEPPFTTVAVDGAEMGRIAAEHLIARMNGRGATPRVLLASRIIVRGST
jgi:LacI family gluconate utilization system Gnt-I transcriptional repressor